MIDWTFGRPVIQSVIELDMKCESEIKRQGRLRMDGRTGAFGSSTVTCVKSITNSSCV